jgi:hypothetical protein
MRASSINIILHFLDIVIVIIFLSFCFHPRNAAYDAKHGQGETDSRSREISQI